MPSFGEWARSLRGSGWGLLGVIVLNVTMRHLFGAGRIEFEELQWHLYAVGFLVGLAYCVQSDSHIRIDFLRERFAPPACGSGSNLYGLLLLLLPFVAHGADLVHRLRGRFVAEPGEAAARESARAFGDALTRGDASLLRPILPDKGKVRLHFEKLGSEQGYFSANQVEALLQDSLDRQRAADFEILHVESQQKGFALVHVRAALSAPGSPPQVVSLRLGMQTEDQRWVLREIRETRR